MALLTVAGTANACLTSTAVLLIDQDPLSPPPMSSLYSESWAAVSNGWGWQGPALRTGQPAGAGAEGQGHLGESLVLGY